MCDQRAGYGHALFLSARQFAGVMVRPVGKSQTVKILHGQSVALAPGDTLVKEGQRHVLHRILESHQVETLEDEPKQPVAQVGGTRLAQFPDGRARQHVFALIIGVQDAQDVEQGTLARPGRTHDGHQFALGDVQVNAPEHMQGLCTLVGLVYAFQVYHSPVTLSFPVFRSPAPDFPGRRVRHLPLTSTSPAPETRHSSMLQSTVRSRSPAPETEA